MQAIRKLSRKLKTPSKSALGSDAAAATARGVPHQFVEHKNEVKGACLKEGQVRLHLFLILMIT